MTPAITPCTAITRKRICRRSIVTGTALRITNIARGASAALIGTTSGVSRSAPMAGAVTSSSAARTMPIPAEYQKKVLYVRAVGFAACRMYVESPMSAISCRRGGRAIAIATTPKSSGDSSRARITTVTNPVSLTDQVCAVVQAMPPAAMRARPVEPFASGPFISSPASPR
jgi:hypothetical protein